MPVFIAESLEICDPVLAFGRIMEKIGIEQYLKPEDGSRIGRPRYCRVNMLKTILYGFMGTGYASLRELEDRCKVNLRYMYLMDSETPTYPCFGDFINEELAEGIEDKAAVDVILSFSEKLCQAYALKELFFESCSQAYINIKTREFLSSCVVVSYTADGERTACKDEKCYKMASQKDFQRYCRRVDMYSVTSGVKCNPVEV